MWAESLDICFINCSPFKLVDFLASHKVDPSSFNFINDLCICANWRFTRSQGADHPRSRCSVLITRRKLLRTLVRLRVIFAWAMHNTLWNTFAALSNAFEGISKDSVVAFNWAKWEFFSHIDTCANFISFLFSVSHNAVALAFISCLILCVFTSCMSICTNSRFD